MPRRCRLALALILLCGLLLANDSSLWQEYGLVRSSTTHYPRYILTAYQMKDLTGALAAWEWLRSADGRPCDLASFCTAEGKRTLIFDDNYVLAFDGSPPHKAEVDAALQSLPDKRDSSLPAILTFLPRQDLVQNSTRYVLGPASAQAFLPELAASDLGFDKGAEAQVAEYKVANSSRPVRLVIFYFATPQLARLHTIAFKLIPGARVKRSAFLVAVVLPPATDEQSDMLLSRVEYQANVTWNEVPPPSPIKPLYSLLLNIIYLSIILTAICLAGGLIYAGMRLYRRRYGQLEADEAMITLRLTGD